MVKKYVKKIVKRNVVRNVAIKPKAIASKSRILSNSKTTKSKTTKTTKSKTTTRTQKIKPIKDVAMPKESQVPVKCGDDVLVGTLLEPVKKSQTLVIMIHGFLAHRNQSLLRTIAMKLAENGVASYRFDFSGNGDSEGDFEESTPMKMLSEIKAVHSYFSGKYKRILLLGHCLGGTLSVIAAVDLKISGTIIIAAPVKMRQAADKILDERQRTELAKTGTATVTVKRSFGDMPYTVKRKMFDEFNSLDVLSSARTLRCPALVIHGTADLFIPLSDSEELIAVLPRKDVYIVGGADHNFKDPKYQEIAAKRISEWVGKNRL